MATEAKSGGAWIDLIALAFALFLAWWRHWSARDLVWGLWLSSLLIGYASIVLMIFGPLFRAHGTEGKAAGLAHMPAPVKIAGGLFMLVFFTVHFGGFHFVHSVFLNAFFPVIDEGHRGFPTPHVYALVFSSYWMFVIAAAVSERHRLAAAMRTANMMGPYKNVVRMHLLIFFFAGAAVLKLDSFIIYAVVLLVYFFPTRIFRRGKPSSAVESPA